jgi:hypothetical protein
MIAMLRPEMPLKSMGEKQEEAFPCSSQGPSLLPIDLCHEDAFDWLKRRKFVLTTSISEQMGQNKKGILSMCVFARWTHRVLVEPC